MKILVVGQRFLTSKLDEAYFAGNNFITIKPTDQEKHVIWQNGQNVLKLTFDDISTPLEGCTVFSKKHAQRICEFVKGIDASKTLIINCVGGISRSGAVGLVLDEYFNKHLTQNDEDHRLFVENNRQIIPNRRIADMLRKELGIHPSRAPKKSDPWTEKA